MSSLEVAVGCVRRSSPEAWTGQKWFKGADGYPILPLSQIQKNDFVFSEEDDISYEEAKRCCEEIRSRVGFTPFFVRPRPREESNERRCTILENLARTLLEDFKVLKERGDIPADTAQPDDPYDLFEDPSEPAPSMLGWTIDTYYTAFPELTEYQLIVPMRAHKEEYLYTEWDKYCTTFSKYDTDVDYVDYCADLSKKIKWIEAYLSPDYVKQLCGVQCHIGWKQAVKIATGFSHLPMELAKRGYQEHTKNLQFELELKDYALAAFEVWKLVIKKKMCPKDALMQALADNTFNYPFMVEHMFNGGGPYYLHFMDFMDEIPIVNDDEALRLISELIHQRAQRPKLYLDFVKLKLEVARRTGLM